MPARPPVAIPGALAGQHLARLREASTPPHAFRRHAGALSALVLARALEDLEERRAEVQTPLARASALEDLGVARLAVGESGDGIDALDQALALYGDAGASWDASRVRGRLRAHGVRRRRVAAAPPPASPPAGEP